MPFTYQEFDTTASALVADLKTKILLSSDYSNPTGNVVVATTPLGAKIAVKLDDITPTVTKAGFAPYRGWSGVTGTDILQGRYTYYKRSSGGTTAGTPLHVRVSAGTTLLYIDIEGPRASETNTDSATYGSYRNVFAVSQITPYFTTTPLDSIPAVALIASSAYTGNDSVNMSALSTLTHISRNMADTSSWVEGHLEVLSFPQWGITGNGSSWTRQRYAADGNTYMSPFVVSEHIAGLRGRLTDLFFGGWNTPIVQSVPDPNNGLSAGDFVSVGGNTYKMLAPHRTDNSASAHAGGSFGYYNNYQNQSVSPLVAVRTA